MNAQEAANRIRWALNDLYAASMEISSAEFGSGSVSSADMYVQGAICTLELLTAELQGDQESGNAKNERRF